MDAFTITPAVPEPFPVETPSEPILVDNDGYGTGGSHSGCTIA